MYRRLATLLGGDLQVRDRTDGVRGARFGLRLPLRLPPPALVEPAVVAAAATSPVLDLAVTTQLQQDGRSTILVKRSVLIMDDSEGNRRLLRRMLQQLGCRVVEAADGDEVLAALASISISGAAIDIVLMDVEMARTDGVSAVREMRRAGWKTPVVAVTGHAGGECAQLRAVM